MSPTQDEHQSNLENQINQSEELMKINSRLIQENEMLRSQIEKLLNHPPSPVSPSKQNLQYNITKDFSSQSDSGSGQNAYMEVDNEMNILEVSEAYCRMSGFLRDELLQMNMLDLDVFVSNTVIVGFTETLSREGTVRFQTVHRRKDGTYWDVEISAGYQDEEKNVIHAFLRDITSEKKSLKPFLNYQNLFSTLMSTLPDLVWLKDAEGTCQLCNKKFATSFGLSEEEAVGKNDKDLFPSDIANKIFLNDQRVLQSCKTETFEESYTFHSDNQTHHFETTRIPVLSQDNQCRGILCIARDITVLKHTNEILSRHDATLKAVLNNAKFGYWEYDFPSAAFTISDEVTALCGNGNLPLNGMEGLIQLVHPNDRPMVTVCLNLAIVAQKPFDIIHRVQKPDSGVLFFEHRCKFEYDDAGKLLRALGTLQDITHEQEHKKRIYQLSTAIEQTTDTIFITNVAGDIEYFNASMVNSFGYSPRELLGSNPRILKSGLREESFYQNLWGTILKGESFRAEFINKRKDGSFVFEDRNITPLKNLTGEIIGFLSVGRDLTEKKLAEIKLNKSERKYAHILRTALDGFMIHDIRGNIREANDTYCQMSGYTRDELLKMNVLDIVPVSGKSDMATLIAQLLTDGQARFESVHQRKDGSLFIVEESALVNEYDEKNVIVFLKDITEKKKNIRDLIEAKESAEQMNKLKSSFLANMSHELRTPLIGIIGFSEIMQSGALDEETKEMAQIIFNSGQRLLRTFNLILDISRIESENSRLKIEAVNLQNILQTCLTEYEPKIQAKGLELKKNLPVDPVIAYTDQNLLEQILTNLIDNAFRFTDMGMVTVRIFSHDHRRVCIEIEDTGIGIEPEVRSVIFDEFRQGSEGLNRAYEGTGLGLSLVKKYVNLLGGEIWVDSTPGVGSVFTISLPAEDILANQKNELAGGQMITGHTTAAPHISGNILFISDDLSVRSIKDEAADSELHIVFADNLEQGLIALDDKNFNLILIETDLSDNRSNQERIRLLNEKFPFEPVPIVAITELSRSLDADLYTQIGYSDIITRPLSMQKLRSLLSRYLRKKDIP